MAEEVEQNDEDLTYEYFKSADVKKEQLQEIATYYDLEVEKPTVPNLKEALVNAEIDDNMYGIWASDPAGGAPAEEEEPVDDEVDDGIVRTTDVNVQDNKPLATQAKNEKKKIAVPVDKLLVKMVRKNASFEVLGFRFTQEHPYHLIPVETAEFIITNYKGFQQALPSELADYYN